ncbi:hypothetical protein [Streptomyces sp. NPDC053048]|uniref:hypothetical protein n=1 Tax=Streptomyces sp. NPDC053048 TaxID=3365694 RepID=UPI0037D71DE6
MHRRDDRILGTRRRPAAGARAPELDVHPAFERFLRAVREEVESRLPPDVVENRLRQLLASQARGPAPCQDPTAADPVPFENRAHWAAYGYRAARLWLAAVATAGRPGLEPVRRDAQKIAEEAVARAVNSFRDRQQPPLPAPGAATRALKTAFLTECVRHLPYAHRSHHLGTEQAGFDEFDGFENPGGADLVRVLWECAATGEARALRRAADQDEEAGNGTEEIVTLTAAAIRAASRLYPDAVPPSSIT